MALLALRPRRRARRRRATPATTPARSAIRCSSSRRSPAVRVASVLAAHAEGRNAWPSRPRPSSGSAPDQLATRLPALWMHRPGAPRARAGSTRRWPSLRRGAAIAAETGRERLLLMLMVGVGARRWSSSARWRRRSRRPRTAVGARAVRRQPAHAAVGAQRARRRRGWRRATSPPRCAHAGEAAALGMPARRPRRGPARLVPRRRAHRSRQRRRGGRRDARVVRRRRAAGRPAGRAPGRRRRPGRGAARRAATSAARARPRSPRARPRRREPARRGRRPSPASPARPCCWPGATPRRRRAAAAAARRAVGGDAPLAVRARAARRGAGAGRRGRPAAPRSRR